MVNVAIIGASGKMGQLVVNIVRNSDTLSIAQELVDDGTFGRELLLDRDDAISRITGMQSGGNTNVVVEFTVAGRSLLNVVALLKNGNQRIVVGTSGWSKQELNNLKQILVDFPEAKVLIVPNFSISAILQMMWVKQAVKLFEDVEIFEYHHKSKLDKPSGTALRLQDDIEFITKQRPLVHSVRASGYMATQKVELTNLSERLIITQDITSREAFMSGVLLAIQKIMTNDVAYGLTVGLDIIISNLISKQSLGEL